MNTVGDFKGTCERDNCIGVKKVIMWFYSSGRRIKKLWLCKGNVKNSLMNLIERL